jgi:hypothetical protein
VRGHSVGQAWEAVRLEMTSELTGLDGLSNKVDCLFDKVADERSERFFFAAETDDHGVEHGLGIEAPPDQRMSGSIRPSE